MLKREVFRFGKVTPAKKREQAHEGQGNKPSNGRVEERPQIRGHKCPFQTSDRQWRASSRREARCPLAPPRRHLTAQVRVQRHGLRLNDGTQNLHLPVFLDGDLGSLLAVQIDRGNLHDLLGQGL